MKAIASGRVINKLRQHKDEDVRKAARAVYVKWKSHFVGHMERPMLEVACDRKTEKLRNSGKKLLAGALEVQVIIGISSLQTRSVFLF